ncbi:MAG: hypothetical protein CMQ73_05935 [Gammaproteobacteria bacterium]|nr:hypothetical protein [Gammaproteobacteria bacterium]OUT93284.1 MAG: hypothetical protein CBB96_07895 [Gammaproteobacteria bacterium TMED36]|tara:strand:+ start:22007 stop:25201 length:3195 start_codon:yes stop_codon:yes gene_type:complete
MVFKNYSQKNRPINPRDTMQPDSGIIAFFSRHKVAANLLMAILILYGAFGITQLKRQLMPDFGLELVSVDVEWQGASAEDIESNIINAVEPEVRFINGVKEVNSTAFEGRAKMYISFKESVSMTKALTDVQSAVSRITTFPQDIEKPIVTQVLQRDEVCAIDISGPFSEKTLKFYARQIRDDLISLGLANVEFQGVRDSEIWVEISSDNLRELDLTLGQVSSELSSSSIDLPSGSINSGGVSRQIRSDRLARSPNELRDIEVVSKSSGEKVYLSDIANVYETFRVNSNYRVNSEGPSIGLKVYRTRGADSLVSQEAVEKYMTQVASLYPASLEIVVYDVFSDQVRQRINMILENGGTGLILVLLVLFVFLNGRVAIWVAAGIPVAFMAALGAMSQMGLSLDMISMFALIMGIGIVVDDAIVVSEHTTTLHRRGMNYKEAARLGAQRMFPPVLAAMLTTVAAFLPILLIQNDVGNIISAVPITLSLVIIASLVECFLILPHHLRSSLKKVSEGENKPRKFDIYFNRFRDDRVLPIIEKTYTKKGFTITATICMLLVSLTLLSTGRVNFEFFDTPESDILLANFSFSPGTSEERTEEMVNEIGRALYSVEEKLTGQKGSLVNYGVGNIGVSYTGKGSFSSDVSGGHIGSFVAELVSGDVRLIRNREFIEAWEAETRIMSGIENFVIFEDSVGGPPGRDIDIRVIGDNLSQMKKAALALRNEMRVLPGLIALEDDLPYGKEEILLEIKPEGEAIGFTAEEVARQVRNSFSGSVAQRFSQDTEEVIVRVKLPAGETENQTIRDIYLTAPDGGSVVLSEVVNLKKRLGFTKIRKKDGVRQVAVTGDVDPTVTTTNIVLQAVRTDIEPLIERDYGVRLVYDGKALEQAEAFSGLRLALIITFASIFIILAWVFSSYTTPFLILAVVPFGLIGAILGHLVLGFNLSMFSLLAFFGLTGVLVNDSIILVRAIKEFQSDGYILIRAINEAIRERFRPVLITTITTIVGLTPIIFEGSLQARLIQPLAITFIFGMLFVPYLVLVFVPALICFVNDVREGKYNLRLKLRLTQKTS